MRRARRNKYALMNDDDSDSSYPLLPTEVIITNKSGSVPDLPGTPTKQAEFPCYDQSALKDASNRSHVSNEDEVYPDPVISYMGSFESSADEDEADPIISPAFSNEMDWSADMTEDGDSDSDVSSESSSSDERRSSLSSQRRRRSQRGRGRGYSSVRSVVSSTSLLDTFIAEETDADLQEHEGVGKYSIAELYEKLWSGTSSPVNPQDEGSTGRRAQRGQKRPLQEHTVDDEGKRRASGKARRGSKRLRPLQYELL